MSECFMSVYYMWRSEEYVILELELWVICELTWGCWKSNPSLLQEQDNPSWPQKINNPCIPINSLNAETKRPRSLQPVWATRRILSENKTKQPPQNKTKTKPTVLIYSPTSIFFPYKTCPWQRELWSILPHDKLTHLKSVNLSF